MWVNNDPMAMIWSIDLLVAIENATTLHQSWDERGAGVIKGKWNLTHCYLILARIHIISFLIGLIRGELFSLPTRTISTEVGPNTRGDQILRIALCI